MKQFKNLFPFIAAIGVFFLASNSPMWKQMNQKPSIENEIKPTSWLFTKAPAKINTRIEKTRILDSTLAIVSNENELDTSWAYWNISWTIFDGNIDILARISSYIFWVSTVRLYV